MDVSFVRDYINLVDHLSDALLLVDKTYEFIGMSAEEWGRLSSQEKRGYLQTMADDVIYALGAMQKVRVGESIISYEHQAQAIIVNSANDVAHVIRLK
ncbi:hypothetical protein P4637_14280 [Halalkalibacterium halodurans]|jgi:hypothetical protein|uniref:BH2997 protein n=1 Tax=Halalkalibacterium halodurans (strain ATCC BAA-125 / DSM 18197 / FERM 7344 / JCM 9153 / C-125) TaxID=272558 RepID=Q9K8K9_HALH5|nr:hypothetical protein [Halalkalibacterium halodurans]MED4082814.1 hypothetical protein [Halalkalibacterium halodurans]MED4085973.1 hypothetical protein [Halalkalibacterium halodurans]MED4103143.1 hypothetical protein [Halalkalibacterium halodurans]MED4109479.1 hypothetical protein [Halalkalibacterium halodurans]MED4123146.1 hypothetical protein [Halalkalibacterium halodurans]